MNHDLLRVIESCDAMLFDFDGPLCDVFAGLPADTVARRLEAMVGEEVATDDPLEVLRFAESRGAAVMSAIESALIAAEVEAVSCSVANDGGIASLQRCVRTGRMAAIVSNNSADAVEMYLSTHMLSELVHPVIGRRFAEPRLMKPNPEPVLAALKELGIAPEKALYVGDSLSDLEVSRTVGMPCVAYANKEWKVAAFDRPNVVVVESMWTLANALQA